MSFVAQFQLDLPAARVEIGELFSGMLLRIEQGGDDDEFGFLSRAVLIVEADETQFHGFGHCVSLLAGQGAAAAMLRVFPGDDAFVGIDFPALAPVERLVARVVEAHEDVGTLFAAAGDKSVSAEGTVGE